VGDPVLDQLDVGIALVGEDLTAAVKDVQHERLDDEAALQWIADDDLSLRRIEVLVHVACANDIGRVRRVAQVERLRGGDQTKSAAGTCHRVVTATAGASVYGRATLDLELGKKDRVDALLKVREGEVLVALGVQRIAHLGGIPEWVR
jgi:hypothetical protein